MSAHELTYEEREILHRHHDGEASDLDFRRAERLMEQRPEARAYVSALQEVAMAARAAEQEAWERAGQVSVEMWGEAIIARAALAEQAPLESIVGMLDRYHDNEVTEPELADVEALIAQREDVSSYVEGLQALGRGVHAASAKALDEVNFSGFWEGIEARLPRQQEASRQRSNVIELPSAGRRKRGVPSTLERPAFMSEDHQVLLYRYHDGEASAQERAQVAAWAEIDPQVSATLGALDEINLAVRVALEQAQERVEASEIWAGVRDRLEHEISLKDQGVVSLAAHREEAAPAPAVSMFQRYRREAIVALAAVICTVLGIALFGESLPGERVVVEKTVVIVDSVEYEAWRRGARDQGRDRLRVGAGARGPR